MKKTYIVTDSTADLSNEYVRWNNIIVVPLTVTYNGISYKDKVDISIQQLLDMLKEDGDLPKTSQVNPHNFYDIYSKLLEEDCDIISIHISSELSGTYQSALIAKQMINSHNIYIIDSKSVSHGTGLLVMEAVNMVNKGLSAAAAADELLNLSKRLRVAFVLGTLEYLKKGGRLSGTKAAVGNLLNIKPVIHTEEGKLVIYDKIRGFGKARLSLIKYIKDAGIDMELSYAVGSIKYDEDTLEFIKNIEEELGTDNIVKADIGTVVATYSGPDVFGVFFFTK